MTAKMSAYKKTKAAIRKKKAQEYMMGEDIFDDDDLYLERGKRKIDVLDVAKVGTGVVIGGGLGILSGVAAIAITASAAEIVIGGVVTKIAGLVGGCAGLGWGVNAIDKKNQKMKRA